MNAYGITRVSTISQKENTSLEFQKKRIKDYSKLYDINLKGIIEETISGRTEFSSREGISKVKEMIESGECDVILVNKIDRLGRSLLEGLTFLKFCDYNR
jgi:DNA invertase Pin-like site-specific DNA recombinase